MAAIGVALQSDAGAKSRPASTMDGRKLTAAYCRVSTLEQKRRDYGIEIPVRDVTLLAEQQGCFVDRFYRDEGVSGVSERRRGLRRLLRDCRAGRVGTVIIPAVDRLSRNVQLAENLFYGFERAGVQVLIVDMPTYDSRDRKDVLIRHIREAIAEENRKDIIERLWKGRQERVRRGLPPGGNVAYGYRREGKRLLVDAFEAEIVRTIFVLAERNGSGSTAAGIAAALSAQGLMRRNGRPWTQRQVAAIFSRRALYRNGTLRYGEVAGLNSELISWSRA